MKRLIVLFIVAASVIVWAGNRTHTDVESSLRITHTQLMALSDGGCAVQTFATVTSTDGGITQEPSRVAEVAGANRTACLDILDRSLILFKSTNGF